MKEVKEVRLGILSSVELERNRKDIKVALIPVGSQEQHGPNMAMETDTRIGAHIAAEVARAIWPAAVVTPAVPFGISYHHMDYPGSITLRPETLYAIAEDIVSSLKAHGIKHFLFVNGHGGNQDVLRVICSKLRYGMHVNAASMFYFILASDVIGTHVKSPVFGHGDEVEASMALYFEQTDLLKTEEMEFGDIKPRPYPFCSYNKTPGIDVPLTFREYTYNGAEGDPRNGSREFGKIICEAAVNRTVSFLKAFAGLPDREK